ncbi:RNA polymerase sigma factor [Methylobacterium oxalidis]|uniref:RNA polymerase sigma factor n=1 Tax=Methylobacterium oxalidis TaxID=944322 RepID=UPI003315E13A
MQQMMLLVEPLIPALRRYAAALTRDRADADDLVQDTLELVITRWHQRRTDGSVRSWLFAILHNLAVSRMRQHRRRGGAHLPIDEAHEAALAMPAPQEAAAGSRDLMRALDALTEEQRSVLLLVTVEGLSYAETAEVLSVPIGTVMSRLSRARDRMIQLMDDEVGGVRLQRPVLRRLK